MSIHAPMEEFWKRHHQALQKPGWDLELFSRKLAPAVKGKSVLELGCGAGFLSMALARSAARVHGIDFVDENVRLASRLAASVEDQPRPTFSREDVLNFDAGERFDCICGSAIIHEIPLERYPELVGRLKHHLNSQGFCIFLENSYFNFIYRFVRTHLVGRLGVPKLGSPDETPFDPARLEYLTSQFRHVDRRCDVFIMFDRFWYQFANERVRRVLPAVARWCGDACTRCDQLITRKAADNVVARYWSWTQTIYLSDTQPRSGVIPD